MIASNMFLIGNIISDGVLDIDGQVDGNIHAHCVTLRPNGRIQGDILADEVHIHGQVQGVIKAQNVTLYATAQVKGAVLHESLSVEDGALVDGAMKRIERASLDEGSQATGSLSLVPAITDSIFDNDNDTAPSEAEIRILDNLRLIR